MNNIDQAFDQLQSDIKTSINGELSASGWYSINCPICKNKNQNKKKGGFKFESDVIAYSCFRGSCDASIVYTKGEYVPKKFKDLMEAIGVKIPMELKAANGKKKRLFEETSNVFEKNFYEDVDFHKHFSDDIPDHWIDELAKRNVIHDVGFKVATKGKFEGSLVIPHWFYDKLIGWDYWTRDGNYITSDESNENMIFVPSAFIPKTVFVVEGMFDALCFPNTVAVKKATITPKQAYHLRNSRVIVIPDRSGSKLYESAKYFGWEVSIPMWKEKDLNEAVENKGLLVAAKMIYDGTMKTSSKSDIYYKRWINDR